MNTKVLVYDSQEGYFELLKKSIRDCNFILYKNSNTTMMQDVGMIIFFMSDRLELADYIKLYRRNIPIIFGLTNKASFKGKDHEKKGNIYFMNLDMHKQSLLKYVNKIINKLEAVRKAIKKAG